MTKRSGNGNGTQRSSTIKNGVVAGGLAEKRRRGSKRERTRVSHAGQPGQWHPADSVTNLSQFARTFLVLAMEVLHRGKPGQLATPLPSHSPAGPSLCSLRRTLVSALDTWVISEMTVCIPPHLGSTDTWRQLQFTPKEENILGCNTQREWPTNNCPHLCPHCSIRPVSPLPTLPPMGPKSDPSKPQAEKAFPLGTPPEPHCP